VVHKLSDLHSGDVGSLYTQGNLDIVDKFFYRKYLGNIYIKQKCCLHDASNSHVLKIYLILKEVFTNKDRYAIICKI